VDIIFGAGVDENLTGEIILSLIIAGKEDLKSDQEGLDLDIFHSDDLEIPTFLRKGGN